MAAIGDVLVKFVADFAEFSANIGKSQKEIESWSKSIAQAGQSVEGFIALAKRVTGALALTEAIRQVISYANEIEKAAATTADLARSTGLTSAQVQALQALAAKTGDSFAELVKKGQANHEWLDQVTADAQRLGQVMDDSVIRTLKDLQVQSDEASRRMQVLFSPYVAGTKSWIADQLERIAADLTTIGMQQGVIDKIIALAQMLGYGGGAGAAGQFRIDTLTDQVARAEQALASTQARAAQGASPREIGLGVAPDFDKQVKDAQKTLDDARVLLGQAKDAAARAAYGTATVDAKAITVTDDKPTGGAGGKTDNDSIQAQIKRYEALTAASKKAYDTIEGGANETIEALKRQVAVQEQIDTIAAKLGARYDKADQTLKDQLKDQLTAYAAQRDATQHALEVEQAAVETDKKYGDGTVALTKLHKDLAEQKKNNRISQEDLTRATKDGTEAIQQAALAAKRYDDDLGSLVAGFEHAANAYARSNDLYSVGERAFNGLTSSMMEGLKALEGQSQKSFGQIAADFANMLAELALQAAASAAFKAIFGAIGGSVGGGVPYGPPAPAVAGALAGGGPVSPGSTYLVGEQGPEYFVPAAAGNIVPMSQAGNSGGGDVNVSVNMSGGGGTSDPNQALEFGRRVKAAVVGVIQNEQRPGGTLYQRRSA